mgnify:CR=1 FL=1
MAEVAQNANLHKRALNGLYYPPLIFSIKSSRLEKKNNAKLLKI